MNELSGLTIVQAHEGLEKKKFSSLELTRAIFQEIKKREKEIGAFINLTPEVALNEAQNVDKLISDNQPIGLLAGIPVSIKDVISTRGIKTTAASRILENYIPPYDAMVVEKLRGERAVIVGKTNCDEFAMGASTENSAFKKTKNPRDPTRVPGGSSGGAAASVAANMSLFALGSDTGGSIRQPAGLCGVVGLKPTYGRVSRWGLIAMGSSLDCIGPITKTVEDAACVLSVIAGKDPRDATSVKTSVPNYQKNIERGVRGVKIGVPKEYFGPGLDKNVKEKVEAAILKLEKLGAKVLEISVPRQEFALATYYIIMASEASTNLARYDGIRFGKARESFGDEAKRRIMLGTYALSSGYFDQYYNQASKMRSLLRDDFKKAFQRVDVIISPVSPTVAWKLGEKINDPLQMYLSDIYTVTANLVGIPAISLPYLPSDGNLPVGLQIMGPHFGEEKILQVAYAYEQTNKI